MKRILYLSVLFIFPLSSSAQAAGGLYEKDSARTVFADEIETLPAPQLEYFPSREEKIGQEEKPGTRELNTERKREQKESEEYARLKVGQSVKPDASAALSDQEILEKFGNPNKPFPVTGVKDAPLPFQGMLTALNAGKPELAKQYARQFLHYINEVKATTERAQELYKEILTEDGLRDQNGNPILDQQTAEQKDEEKFDEQEARLEVRKSIGDSLPVDPFGKIDIYLFFKLDENSALMMPEAEKLYRTLKSDSRVRFKALLMEPVKADELRDFLKLHGVSFPVKVGAAMSQRLQLTVAPSTVLIASTSKKSVIEEGARRFFYLDELVRLMQGKGT